MIYAMTGKYNAYTQAKLFKKILEPVLYNILCSYNYM